MTDRNVMENLAKELSSSNKNIESLIDVTKEQIHSSETNVTKSVGAFQKDRDNIMVGVARIGEYVISNNEVVKSNNEAITTAFAGFLEEVVGIKDGLKDVTASLREVSENIIEHRTQTREWKVQNEKESKVYMELFSKLESKLDHMEIEIGEVKTNVAVIEARQEGNKELNGTKISNVLDRGEAINNTENIIKTRGISLASIITTVVVAGFSVAATYLSTKS